MDWTQTLAAESRNAYTYLRQVCGLGVRYAGTPGERAARDWIEAHLRRCTPSSLSVEVFPYLGYTPHAASLEILRAGNPSERKTPEASTPEIETAIPCEPIQYAAGGTVVGEALFVGPGEPSDWDNLAVDPAGRIAIIESPFPFRVIPRAEAYGAAGVVLVGDAPDDLIRVGTATFDRKPGRIPAVAVSAGSGRVLRERLSAAAGGGGRTLRLHSEGTFQAARSWNVVATWEGTDLAGERVLVGSHYDSQILGEHAWDNGTGTAALMALAGCMNVLRPRRTVDLVFFGVEELGPFTGSYAYVHQHADDLADVRVMLNLDGFSSGWSERIRLEATPDVRAYGRKIAREAGAAVDDVGSPAPHSDHVPFQERGIPVLWLHSGLDPYYHTVKDRFAHVDPEKLARAVRLAGTFVWRLARDERFAETTGEREPSKVGRGNSIGAADLLDSGFAAPIR